MRGAVGGAGLIAVVVVGLMLRNSRVPETPANALLDWQVKVVEGDVVGAWERLCTRAKEDALSVPMGKRFQEIRSFLEFRGQFYTDYESVIDGDVAKTPIAVVARGAEDDESAQKWTASLVKQDRTWRVCGFEPPKRDR